MITVVNPDITAVGTSRQPTNQPVTLRDPVEEGLSVGETAEV